MTHRSVSIMILVILACLYTLHFARIVLVPFTLAFLLNLLFSPMIIKLKRFGIPSSLSAAVVMLLLLTCLLTAISVLREPAVEWINEAPTNLRQLTREFNKFKEPLEDIKELGKEMEEMTQLKDPKPKAQSVSIKGPTALETVIQGVPSFIVSLLVTILTSFFLLASGDELAKRLLTFGRSWVAKRHILRVTRQIQRDVSKYLRTVTLINSLLGIAVAVLMWYLGVPNPELWGAMVAVLNFAPYVGAIVSTVVLTVVGAATFSSPAEALMVPGSFLVMTSLEGALFTPLVLGRQLSLNPLVVFMSVILWGWLWGVIGALIAVPLLSSTKVVLSHIEATRPLAYMMEGTKNIQSI